MLIAGIDPGPEASALVVLNTATWRVDLARYLPNERMLDAICPDVRLEVDWRDHGFVAFCGLEWLMTYRKVVGQSVFQTCRWVGRFEERWIDRGTEPRLISNVEIRQNLCHVHDRAGAGEIRAALIDRFGGPDRAVGVKKAPGPLYALRLGPKGCARHLWSALGVAVTLADRLAEPRSPSKPARDGGSDEIGAPGGA